MMREVSEQNVSKLIDEVKATKNELQIERSWRMSNDSKVQALMDKIPPYVGKGEPNSEVNKVDDTLDVSKLQNEAEAFNSQPSYLLEKNLDLRKALEAQIAVFDQFRQWIESQKFDNNMRFTEFNADEIEKALESSKLIGSGGYGKVFKSSIGEKPVAIKILDEASKQGLREYTTEVALLKKVHHQNLVHLIGACPDKNALVYEYLENGTLDQRLGDQSRMLQWRKRLAVALDICSALIFLHNIRPKPIVHGDLKPENILFDGDDNMKLCDFGISHQLEDVSETGTWHHITGGTPRGTSGYIDPEFQMTGKLTPLADEYAFGVILLQLVTGQGSSGLVKFVEENLKNITALKNKSLPLQRKILSRVGLVDKELGNEDWHPEAVLLLLQLGLACANPESKRRPSLSGSVWPQLYIVCQESDYS